MPISVGGKLRNIREKQGITQVELARRMDVSRQRVSQWETLGMRPLIGTRDRLAKALDISPQELVPDEDSDDRRIRLRFGDEKNYIGFLKRLRELCLQRAMSPAALIRQMRNGNTTDWILKVIEGKRVPHEKTIAQLAKALQVSQKFLQFGIEETNRRPKEAP